MNIFKSANPCPKCGFKKSEVRWESGMDWLKRACKRCGFWWDEKPLDGEKKSG